jgi:hypothetical protein
MPEEPRNRNPATSVKVPFSLTYKWNFSMVFPEKSSPYQPWGLLIYWESGIPLCKGGEAENTNSKNLMVSWFKWHTPKK